MTAIDSPMRVREDDLTAFAAALLVRLGVPANRAARAAETLVLADLRGVSSHGVARLGMYARRIACGTIDPAAELTVVRESPATLALDAGDGLGLALAPEATDRAIAKASETGLAFCTVRNSSHFGIAGAYALQAARAGLGAIAMTNAGPNVAPTGGAQPMLGTNPIAFAVPIGEGEPPLVLDMATSAVALGKIEVARRAGSAIPAGWALDETGSVTTDPFAARWLLPLGGHAETGGHKGYGLALMVDILCGPLAGSLWGTHLATLQRADVRSGIGHAFLVWRIDAFRDPDEFAADLRAMLAELRACPPAPGSGPGCVLIPGDPEAAATAANRDAGIPLDAGVAAELRELGRELEVDFPS